MLGLFIEFPAKCRQAPIYDLDRLGKGVFMNGHVIDYMMQLTNYLR